MRVPQHTAGPPADWGKALGYGAVPPNADAAGPPPVTEPGRAELYWPPGTPPYTSPRPVAYDRTREPRDPFEGTDLDGGGDPEGALFDRLAGAPEDPWDEPGCAPAPGSSQSLTPRQPGGYTPTVIPHYDEADIRWLVPPTAMEDSLVLGWVHTASQCPLMIVRLLDELGDHRDLVGSVEGILDLSAYLSKTATGLACVASHIHGPQPIRGPVDQARTA